MMYQLSGRVDEQNRTIAEQPDGTKVGGCGYPQSSPHSGNTQIKMNLHILRVHNHDRVVWSTLMKK